METYKYNLFLYYGSILRTYAYFCCCRYNLAPVAVDEIAGEGRVVEGEVPGPAGAALVVVEHHPAQPLYVGLEQTVTAASPLDVLQLALVAVVAVFPAIFPQSNLFMGDA